MDLCRHVYSSAPPASSRSDKLTIDGKMRGENIEELFGVVKRIVGADELGMSLSGCIAQVDAFSTQCHDEVAKSLEEDKESKKEKGGNKKETKKTKKGRLF
mmetsp:Transcript_25032/g.38962  ORF Transcript_25032/g.38962 Transcript_25032/m.38962 type:complete len:101 (-) Transcript_25032:51-353(-)